MLRRRVVRLTGVVVSGLTRGVGYLFRVRAVNAAGPGAWSGSSDVVLVPTSVPGAVSGVAAVAGDESVTVSWTAPSDGGGLSVTGFAVRVFVGDAEPEVTTLFAAAGATQLVVPGLTNGVGYRFDVAAVNDLGRWAEVGQDRCGDPVGGSGGADGERGAVVPNTTQVTVSWTASA